MKKITTSNPSCSIKVKDEGSSITLDIPKSFLGEKYLDTLKESVWISMSNGIVYVTHSKPESIIPPMMGIEDFLTMEE